MSTVPTKEEVIAGSRELPAPGLLLRTLLYALLFSLPWLKLPLLSVITASQFFVFVWGVTVILVLVLYGSWKGIFAVPRSVFFPFVVAWFGTFALASVFSILPLSSLWGSYPNWTDGIVYLLACLVFSYAFLAMRPAKNDLWIVVILVLVQAFLLSLMTVYSAVEGGFPRSVVRPISPLYNSDFFISYILLVLPLACVMVVRSWKMGLGRVTSSIFTMCFAVMVLAFYVSLPAGFQEIVKGAISPSEKSSSNVSQFLGNESNSERYTEWQLGMEIGKDNLLLGTGPGTVRTSFFALVGGGRVPEWNYQEGKVMDHPHNDFIEQFATTGVLGLLAYVAVWTAFFWQFWKKRQNIDEDIRPAIYGLVGGLVAFLMFNQFVFTTFVPGVMAPLFMVIVLTFSGSIRYGDGKKLRVLSMAVLSVLLLCFLAVSYWSKGYFQAEQLSVLATAYSQPGKTQDMVTSASLSQQASNVFPVNDFYAWQASDATRQVLFNPPEDVELTDVDALKQSILTYSKRALSLDTHNPTYRLDVTVAEYISSIPGSWEEARAENDMQEAIALEPQYYFMYIRANDAYTYKKQYAKGKEMLQKARSLVPGSVLPSLESYARKIEALDR